MAEINSLRRRIIEDMSVRNLSPATSDPTSHSLEVQLVFWPFPGSSGIGGCPRLPSASGFQGHFLGVAQANRRNRCYRTTCSSVVCGA